MLLRTWRVLSGLLVFLALVYAAPAQAQVADPELAKALAYYERGDFSRAAADLAGLVDEPRLNADERARAREALGVSYYVMGRLLDARRQFTRLLEADPNYQPDPLYVAPEIVAFVAEVRRGVAPRAATAPVERVYAEPATAGVSAKPVPDPIAMPLVAEPGLTAVDFLPFGAGQFRRGQTTRGVTLAVVEGLFLATNVSLYYYRRCSLKACTDHYYAPDTVDRARHLQTYQLIAGSLFVATAVLGVADGIAMPLGNHNQISIAPGGMGLRIAWESK